MDRQTTLTAVIAICSVLSLLFRILTGVPAFVNQLSAFLGPLPIEFLSTWSERVGLLLLGLVVGWIAHQRVTESFTIDEIEGCVNVRDVVWKGTATLSDGELSSLDIEGTPTCPECRSPMNSEERKSRSRTGIAPSRGSMFFWTCPSSECGLSVKKDFDRDDEAVSLLNKHFDRILEDMGQEYYLDNLVERLDESFSPRDIWLEYASIVDDSDVSTACFES